MTEKELIRKIQSLREIKPRQEWVSLLKEQILGEEIQPARVPFFSRLLRPALATTVALGVLGGLFFLSQNSLPGDFLYPLKKFAEQSQTFFIPQQEKPVFQLKLANKRLEELKEIAQSNQTEKLATAFTEFQSSVSKASQKLKKAKQPEKIAATVIKESQKLNQTTKGVEKILSAKIVGKKTEEELNQTVLSYYKIEAGRLIAAAKKASLTDAQKEDLLKVEGYYQNGEYQKAFEYYLTSSLNKTSDQ